MGGVFETIDPAFADWLRLNAQFAVPTDAQFGAQNFLIDEWVSTARADSYLSTFSNIPHAAVDAWYMGHENYLRDFVYLAPAFGKGYLAFDQADATECPETFRLGNQTRLLSGIDRDIALLRVVELNSVARTIPIPPGQLETLLTDQIMGRRRDDDLDAVLGFGEVGSICAPSSRHFGRMSRISSEPIRRQICRGGLTFFATVWA